MRVILGTSHAAVPVSAGPANLTDRADATIHAVSPTIFREGPYRFYFFSREEPRPHVHVASPEGEAKFWLEPQLELAESHGIPEREFTKIVKILERRIDEITSAWRRHFER